jgi:hypothetical protein
VRRPPLKHPRFQETETQSDTGGLKLASSAHTTRRRRFAAQTPRRPLFSDAKNCALIRIAERQRHKLARNLPRLIGGHAASFEQFR